MTYPDLIEKKKLTLGLFSLAFSLKNAFRSGFIRAFLIIFILFKLTPVSAQCSEQEITNLKKIAIVFGEKSYPHYGFLANPLNDATDITESLRKVGFTVFPYYDLGKKNMEQAISDWYDKLKNYDVALFYFSGHGAEVNGQNYLFPVDAAPKSPTELSYNAISANEMLDQLASYDNLKYSIVILDACRSNPFTKGWSRDLSDKGLVAMSAKGAFIAFAASPGHVALDGDKRNGVYTEAILKYITVPNLTIDEIFTKVNADVKKSTKGEQWPFKNSSLGSDYCFSVIRSFKPSAKSRGSGFQQPNSKFLLSKDEQHFFTIENNMDGLTVRDTKTLDILSTIHTGIQHPTIIAINIDDIVFLADSSENIIKAVDWRKKVIIDSIKLEYSPLALFFSADGKKIYTCGNGPKGGELTVIDVTSNVIKKNIPLNVEISKMVISSDCRHLYISSKKNFKTLTIVDTKAEKIAKQLNGLDLGDEILVTPDEKKIYSANVDEETIMVTQLLNASTPKIINIPANSFAFTEDAKYVFAISSKKITMIKCSADEPIYEYPIASTPNGLVTTSDGQAFAWLPAEQYIFNFALFDTSKMISASSDLELKLKDFRQKLNDNKSFDVIRSRIKSEKDSSDRMTACAEMIQKIVVPVIIKVDSDLKNKNFGTFQTSGVYLDSKGKVSDFHYGIRSLLSEKNAINPVFRLRFLTDSFTLMYGDDQIDKALETIEISFHDIKENTLTNNQAISAERFTLDVNTEIQIKKIVREYFLKRLDYLTK